VTPGPLERHGPHLHCVGVGAGPSNISLSSLLHSYPEITSRFFEKRPYFSWHDGQLVNGGSLQVSMLKDLVSLADPASTFSFLSYLHEQGRLYHFLNAQFESVPRHDFRNYLEWACRRNKNIVLGEEVRSVEFDGVFVVRTTNETVTADHVVVAVGMEPWVPDQVGNQRGDTQFHVSEFLTKAERLAGKRVAVVGGGQSGAEAFLDLISRPADQAPRRVTWVSRRRNYAPLDDSPFTNDYFTPAFSDHFARLDPATRDNLNAVHVLASDGISESTLRAIYQQVYLRRYVDEATDMCVLLPAREVTRVTNGGNGWVVTMTHRDQPGTVERLNADAIVWATGYRPARMEFLAPIEDRLEREGAEYRIDDHFAVHWDGPPDHHIFIQNGARQQRGVADPNLSLIAWRSQRIVDRLRGVYSDRQDSSLVEWAPRGPVRARTRMEERRMEERR
jgi:lysine N6-hydroxylase